MQKTKLRVRDKMIKLREETEETIGEYEMSVVPRSICAVDGSLYILGDTASLMHAIEEATNEPAESLSPVHIAPVRSSFCLEF